jgi:hypothetical protein
MIGWIVAALLFGSIAGFAAGALVAWRYLPRLAQPAAAAEPEQPQAVVRQVPEPMEVAQQLLDEEVRERMVNDFMREGLSEKAATAAYELTVQEAMRLGASSAW